MQFYNISIIHKHTHTNAYEKCNKKDKMSHIYSDVYIKCYGMHGGNNCIKYLKDQQTFL